MTTVHVDYNIINPEHIEIVANHLALFFKDEPQKIVWWLLTPNPNFGGIPPARLLMNGRGHKVVQLIEASK